MSRIYFQIIVQFIFRFITTWQDNIIADRQINSGENINKKYVWNSEKSEDYVFSIESNEAAFIDLQHQVNAAVSGEDIDRNLMGLHKFDEYGM